MRTWLKIAWAVLSVLGFFGCGSTMHVYGQVPTKETRVDTYDLAHMARITTDPHSQMDNGMLTYVCTVRVTHQDGSVYVIEPFVGIVKSEEDLVTAMTGAFNSCRDFTVKITREKIMYYKATAKNIVDSKHYMRP